MAWKKRLYFFGKAMTEMEERARSSQTREEGPENAPQKYTSKFWRISLEWNRQVSSTLQFKKIQIKILDGEDLNDEDYDAMISPPGPAATTWHRIGTELKTFLKGLIHYMAPYGIM